MCSLDKLPLPRNIESIDNSISSMRSEEHSFELEKEGHHQPYGLVPSLIEIKSIELIKKGIHVCKYHYSSLKKRECKLYLDNSEKNIYWQSITGSTFTKGRCSIS